MANVEVASLASSGLFAGLDQPALEAVIAEAHDRRFDKGQALFREGDPADAFLVISHGAVEVFVTSERGSEMVLATLRPPEALGEVSLLDGGPRSASATALEPTAVLAVARSTLLALIEREQAVADAVLRASARLLRRLTGKAADLVFERDVLSNPLYVGVLGLPMRLVDDDGSGGVLVSGGWDPTEEPDPNRDFDHLYIVAK